MILQGEMGSGKTTVLVEKYIELLNSGVSSENILVLVQNSAKRSKFSDMVREKLRCEGFSKPNIYTFFGLCYNFVLDYWPLVENEIKNPDAPLEPNMCGLEVSQYIFKKCVDACDFKGYNSKMNLLHQLFKRYALIVQNSLSEKEVEERTKILKESFTDESKQAINLYKAKTLSLRAFDYLRQVGVFAHLYKNVENPYQYVLLDDGDEITPACFEYLKYIKPTVKEFFIAYDKMGSSRLGYLSAKITDFEGFLKEKALVLADANPCAVNLFENISKDAPYTPENIDFSSFIRRDEMLDAVVRKINSLLKKGVKPNNIAIVTPCIDGYLKHFLRSLRAQTFFLSGSEKLVQNPYVAGVLTFLKIINKGLYAVSKSEFRILCLKVLGFPLAKSLEQPNLEVFGEFIDEVKDLPLSEQIYKICVNFIKNADKISVTKLNQLMKQIQDFENVFETEQIKDYLITQLEYTIISENPLSSEEIPQSAIVVGTMQKMIDNEVGARHYFWLDISSAQWLKQDIGPLYNAWVFQKDWDEKTFEVEDNIRLTLDKTARVLRKLYLCAKSKVYAYSSVYDFSGVENFGGINKFFDVNTKSDKKTFKIVPRIDQQPVLDYKNDKLAISAVAGSGKTTIMLALILKLLEGGVVAENIFVLTFMESAARNFKERIKENFPHLNELPHISTIHGLALRILKENNNFSFVGLDDDFEIIDEPRRLTILSEIIYSLEMDPSNIELYDRAISTFKSQPCFDIVSVKSALFKRVYESYRRRLLESNYIDYDDLLILSLKLLKTNDGVRVYYQNLAKYVIEDEAQDSSALQQELIELLGQKHGNIIRCGDVNQAITTTFSNSDVEGFKKFIFENKNVKMDHSQRCSKGVYSLANDLIASAFKLGVDAFLDVKMKPVEGKNPTHPKELEAYIFDSQKEEKEHIVSEIKKILKESPKATIGILLRSNWAVAEWSLFMENNAIKTLARTDVLINNPIYEVVMKMFNFILEPKENTYVLELYRTLSKLGFYKDDVDVEWYIARLNVPFIISDGHNFKLWWDLNYFLSRSYLLCGEFALEVADFFFKNSHHRANVVLTSLIVEKIYRSANSFESFVARLNDIAQKPNRFGIKFFDTETTEGLGGRVQIMTMHKAKGDEFDFTFVPELTCESITLDVGDVKLKKNTLFVEGFKLEPKSEEELKKEIVQENYRLLYVAITRAKKSLYLTSAKKYRVFSKIQEKAPCSFLLNIAKEVGV